MVLGAGLGSRLKPFTSRFPKPLFPVLGVPCLEFALLNLREAGVKETVVNTHAFAVQMQTYLKSNPVPGLKLTESPEGELLLGSAGGFRRALEHFRAEAFFAMNADVLHFCDLANLAKEHLRLKKEQNAVMTLVLAKGRALRAQTGEYREIMTDPVSQLIVGFGEKKKNVPFYTGTAIFEPEAFEALSDHQVHEFVPEVLEPWIEAGRVAYVESEALWIDIGSPELWAQAQGRLKNAETQGELPETVRARLKAADPLLNGRFHLSQTKIRWEGIEHEIKDLRNS